MKKPHKHADVIKAWADGADIQWRPDSSSAWADMRTNPSWFEGCEYRVKPEKKPDVAIYVHIVRNHELLRGWDFFKPSNEMPANLRLIFDGETDKLKAAEVL